MAFADRPWSVTEKLAFALGPKSDTPAASRDPVLAFASGGSHC
jgi:hypothetical protein